MGGVTSELMSGTSPYPAVVDSNDDYAVNLVSLNPASLMKIPIGIDGKCLSALVDTGATASLIRSSLVNSADPCAPRVIVGLGGTITIRTSFSSSVDIEGMSTETLTFFVVPDSCLECDVVLGSDFFSRNRILVDIGSRSLRQDFSVGWTNVRFPNHSASEITCSRVPVYASSDVKIHAGESTRVPVCCSRAPCGEVYFDGDLGSQYVRGVDGILSFERDQAGALDLHILMSQPAHARNRTELIRRGTVVGTVSSIVDVEIDDELPLDEWSLDRLTREVDLESLTEEEATAIRRMLFSKRGVFSLGDGDVGLAAVTEHKIELDDHTPIRQRPRRFPEPVVESIEAQCRELLAQDIISPSRSPWSSPVVPIRKRDGSMRLCVDYRKLNAVTKADRFPMPNLTDLVFSLYGMKYFTSLDLVRGYYQVPLAESSQEYTAFSTTRNHYQFKRLSFGLKNAPAAFQRQMQEILQGYLGKQVIVYIDDILIMSRTFDEHMELVGAVLETLSRYGIKIKVPKCRWFRDHVPFLGHIVGCTGLRKAPEYVKRVLDFPRPETVHQLRQFLGLLNFQRKFIPDCSKIAQPLSCLTGGSKRDKLKWTCQMEEAFGRLRELMGEDVLLSFPDYSEGSSPLELYVDASGGGAGACLMQVQRGVYRAIAYNSMTFSKPQKQYSTIDRELAAIRWGVKVFRPFLYGVHFVLYTDHRPLVFMRNMSSENSRIARTLQELSEFDFELRYCRGEDNAAADALSRMSRQEDPLVSDRIDPDYLPSGLEVLESVPGGGDSMVLSLYLVLKERSRQVADMELPSTADALRIVLVEEILSHSQVYGIELTRCRRRELSLMKTTGQLLPEVVLLAACNLFDQQVWVHCGMERPVIHAGPGQPPAGPSGRVHLQWLAGVHFNPVVESGEYKPVVSGNFCVPEERTEVVEPADEGGFGDIEVCAQWPESECSCPPTSCSSVSLNLGGLLRCALVDTGAQISLIREDVYQSLPASLKSADDQHKKHMKLRGVGGGCSPVKGVVCLPVILADKVMTGSHPFAIVSVEMLPFCVLLGANFILDHRITVNFATGCLSWSSDGVRAMCRFRPYEPGEAQIQFCFLHDLVHERRSSVACDEDLRAMQSRDGVLSVLLDEVLQGRDPELWTDPMLQKFRGAYDKFLVRRGILVWRKDGKEVPVASFHFLVECVFLTHQRMAHIGRLKLIEAVLGMVWHPDVYRVANDVCVTCYRCQTHKVSHLPRPPPVLKIKSALPFDLISVDLVDFPCTPRRFRSVLMAVDQFSKWLVAVPLQNKRSDSVAHALEHCVLPVLPRCPLRLLSDNGPEFRSSVVNEVLSRFDIIHSYSTPYCPASNGGVERVNRTIAEMLRGLASDRTNWDRNLPQAVMVYNNTSHRSLGMSPSTCLLSRAYDINEGPLLPADVREVWREGHPRFVPFEVGQKVLYRKHRVGNLTGNKLAPKFEGPFVVARVNENGVTYVIQRNCGRGRVAQKPVHYRQIKSYREPPGYLRDHPCYRSRSDVSPVRGVTWEHESDSDSDLPIFVCGSGSSEESSSREEVGSADCIPNVTLDVDSVSSPVLSLPSSLGAVPCAKDIPDLRVAEVPGAPRSSVSVVSGESSAGLARSCVSCPPRLSGDQSGSPRDSVLSECRNLPARRRRKRTRRREPMRYVLGCRKALKDLPCSEDTVDEVSSAVVVADANSMDSDCERGEPVMRMSEVTGGDGLCSQEMEREELVSGVSLGSVEELAAAEAPQDISGSFLGFSEEVGDGESDFGGFESGGAVSRLQELRRIVESARSAIAENRRCSLSRLSDVSLGCLSPASQRVTPVRRVPQRVTPVRRVQTRSLGPVEPIHL